MPMRTMQLLRALQDTILVTVAIVVANLQRHVVLALYVHCEQEPSRLSF